ncbi:DUF402 domain-containing protein [Actinacidiphila yanglinensis]|nr:DUF402 domain-containing protein [Actinacidiphila yanglinensis]
MVRRDVHRGKVWSAQALRVLQDDQDGLVTACWPGAPSLAATSWVQSMVSGNNAWRGQGVEALAAGNWTLDTWTWQRTGLLMWHQSDLWFSINSFYDAGTGQQQCWYVNFQLPYRRTALGFDTFDLFLDLVVTPDLTQWKWKDEDEYAQARRVGVVTDAIHHRVEHAREQALSMIRSYHGPFRPDRRRPVWSPDPSWSLPDLPRGVLHTP